MAAYFFEDILEDILIEILKRLPVSSLIKVMLVQKSWYHLIQSPYFKKVLYSHNQKNTNYILLHCAGDRISLRVNDKQCNQYSCLPFPEDIKGKGYITMFGISNGLICLRYSKTQLIHIWNPIIQKYKTLPHSPIFGDQTYKPCIMGLIFGYVPKINDYKLIEIVKYRHLPDKVAVLVYSLSTNSWKTVRKDNFAKSDHLMNPVIVNGAAYWVGSTSAIAGTVVCFDMESEIIREIMLPSLYSLDITLVQNCSDLFLCKAHYSDTDSDNHSVLDLWKLEKAGIKDVWGEKISIDLQKVGKGERLWFPQCLRNNNELILVYLDDTHGFGCTSYDIEKRESTVIIDDPSDLYSALDVAYGAFPRPIMASFFAENLGLLGDNSNLNLVTKW